VARTAQVRTITNRGDAPSRRRWAADIVIARGVDIEVVIPPGAVIVERSRKPVSRSRAAVDKPAAEA